MARVGMMALLGALVATPVVAWAASDPGSATNNAHLMGTAWGIASVVIFVLAYSLVPIENVIHLRKSKPVLVAAGIIWILAALALGQDGQPEAAHAAIKHNLLEYGELFLFLLAAMTYINSMEERNVFQCLRAYLVTRGYSFRQIFWITGALAFVISPIADNLTTALLMGAVVMAVGGTDRRFVVVACVNIVVAANAGGAFSPFGDITTLMVWQKEKVEFTEFLAIFFPSLVNWLIPAAIMSLSVAKVCPHKLDDEVHLRYGGLAMIVLFLITVASAVCFHSFLHLPPAAGMMFGLGLLGMFSYHIKRHEGRSLNYDGILGQVDAIEVLPIMSPQGNDKLISKIVENCPYPALALDMDHKITHWNDEIEEMTGRSADEMVGTRNQWQPFYREPGPILADLVVDETPHERVQGHYEGRIRARTAGSLQFDGIDYFEAPDGKGRWYAYTAAPIRNEEGETVGAMEFAREIAVEREHSARFDVMQTVARAEWDTLLFFYGVILCVGGLAQFGYLNAISSFMYQDLGATYANALVGVLSAIIDNIPVMFAVLTMDPEMSHGQWLLVTLTAGVGGSMLAIGSAAGVALMGTARGIYTFGAHLRWTWVIAIGYVASIFCHLVINSKVM